MGNACCHDHDDIQHLVVDRGMPLSSRPCGACPCSVKYGRETDMQHEEELSAEYHHVASDELDHLLRELFRLHDLNGNGFLELEELVQLNTKVAMLHYGKDTDLEAVRSRYRALFLERLDPQGRPVPYSTFQRYVCEMLNSMDRDPLAQEMMVEQFAAEARSARAVFHCDGFSSPSDRDFLPSLSSHSSCGAAESEGGLAGLAVLETPRLLSSRVPCSRWQNAHLGGA
eukprot:TRINITY_DN112534_c0_g1_i1.p1 TRINITY_DN112534_c0_g1~~TRINITY_DN112534_c0_g1_i1.p1  ORF type:complete len:228 (-),score=32.33 TRINITY_DN112534_c0_g1_i1:97-780(-)